MKRRLPNTAIAMVTTYNAIHPGWFSSANRYPETGPSGILFTSVEIETPDDDANIPSDIESSRFLTGTSPAFWPDTDMEKSLLLTEPLIVLLSLVFHKLLHINEARIHTFEKVFNRKRF
jgi:hypothetical protein